MDQINFFNMKDVQIVEDQEVNNSLYINSANENGGIPARFHNASFSDFDSPYTDVLRQLCLEPKSDKICIMSGPVGNGKTHLCCSAMHERAVNRLPSGMFLSCRTLKPRIKSTYSFSSKFSEWDLDNKYGTVPFLVIDELGKCPDSQLEWEFFTMIVSMRYDNELPTWITTNMTFQEFKQYVLHSEECGRDVYDRISSVVVPLAFNSESWRVKKCTEK